MTKPHFHAPRRLALLIALAGANATLMTACQAASDAPAGKAQASAPANGKDVVLVPPAATVPAQALGSSSGTAPVAMPVADVAAAPALPVAAQAFSGALGELGLHLLRSQAQQAGRADGNALVSPFSVANALGMLQAGAAGATANEIAAVLEPGVSRGRQLRERMKAVNDALLQPHVAVEFVSANRVWLDQAAGKEIGKPFAATVAATYRGDGALLRFADAPSAAASINRWVNEATHARIPQILPATGLPATTRAVVTNAVYFKGSWSQPFNSAATKNLPFHPRPGQSVDVPTMSAVLDVRTGVVNNLTVVSLPYGNGEFAMVIALPVDAAHTLDALQQDTTGLDIAQWSATLKPATVGLRLPKFRIDPAAWALKDALGAAGVHSAFSAGANFEPMLGKADLVLDNVYHAAGISVDENGSEATAATAAVTRSKGMLPLNVPEIAIDRPFLFAIVHQPTATPLFVGRIFKPA